jgi:hypothetical protein
MKARGLGAVLLMLALGRASFGQVRDVPRAVLLPPTTVDSVDNARQDRHQPQIEDSLIRCLRGDPKESNRYEAAKALDMARYFTEKSLTALLCAADGSTVDGNPAETSQRVKAVALHALRVYTFQVAATSNRPQQTSSTKTAGGVQLAGYAVRPVPPQPQPELFDQACRLQAETISTPPTSKSPSEGADAFDLAVRGQTPAPAPLPVSQYPSFLSARPRQRQPLTLIAPPMLLPQGQ